MSQDAASLTLTVRFDPRKTDADSLADALDSLLESALSTPGILDEYGPVGIGSFEATENMPTAKPEVTIFVEGGVVQDVYASIPLDVTLIDYDDAESGDEEPDEVTAHADEAMKRCPHHVF